MQSDLYNFSFFAYASAVKSFPQSSVGEESACSAGDLGSIPGLGRPPGDGKGSHSRILGLPCDSAGKESACNAGDLGSIPGLGRPPGEGKGSHSRILAWRIPWTIQSMESQSRTRPSDLHFHSAVVSNIRCLVSVRSQRLTLPSLLRVL